MKNKIIKNNIFSFIMGVILFTPLSVFAIFLLNANQVAYSPKKISSSNVQNAIDNLVTKTASGKTCFTNTYYTDYGSVIADIPSFDYKIIGSNVVIKYDGYKKGMCIILNGDLVCFYDNDHEETYDELLQLFGEDNCTYDINEEWVFNEECDEDDYECEEYIYEWEYNRSGNITCSNGQVECSLESDFKCTDLNKDQYCIFYGDSAYCE